MRWRTGRLSPGNKEALTAAGEEQRRARVSRRGPCPLPSSLPSVGLERTPQTEAAGVFFGLGPHE